MIEKLRKISQIFFTRETKPVFPGISEDPILIYHSRVTFESPELNGVTG
jgi:hypothetical protein